MDVKLAQVVTADHKTLWIPVHSIYRHFQDFTSVLQEPVIEESYGIVLDTLTINKGLQDSRFRLPYKPHESDIPAAISEFVTQARSEHLNTSRTIQDQLSEKLAKANEQARELEASAPSRESWVVQNLAQILLTAVGAVVIAAAFVVWRRSA